MDNEKTVRQPKQKRSIQMKEKILSAAMQLICDMGFFETTTNEIAKAAGNSRRFIRFHRQEAKEGTRPTL